MPGSSSSDRNGWEGRTQERDDRAECFAELLAHDLRNPLSVAEGLLELAAEEAESEHLVRVSRAHNRMEAIIAVYLALAREGAMAVEPTRVDLAAAATEAWRHDPSGSATLAVETDRVVRADEEHLGLLLENLLRNAVEHDGNAVTVAVDELDGGLVIADDGPGLAAEDPLAGLDAGYTTGADRTGVGLAIVASVAGAHGWSLDVRDDGGARFEFSDVEIVY